MARRFHSRSTPLETLRYILHAIPWKLLLLLPILFGIAIPTYLYATRMGNRVLPGVTDLIYTLTGGTTPTPAPPPAFPAVLPRFGSILYTVQEGDSCDSILAFQMRMADAGQIFSDANPGTVQALNATLGADCHVIHPGTIIPLSPQYPLIAFGGLITKISATGPQQVLPTPLINVPDQQQQGPDCSGGCLLTVQIAPQTSVQLIVQTQLTLHTGVWIWTHALLARQPVRGFSNYPYVDPHASLNGMVLHSCDFELGNVQDNSAPSCDQIMPNTIDDDGGAWLFGVTGSSALDHWGYHLRLPPNTPVLLWLTSTNGNLKFQRGNPVYRYDDATHVYVKV